LYICKISIVPKNNIDYVWNNFVKKTDIPNMKRTILFWIIAFIITAISAVFQRVTGPSFPKTGNIIFEGKTISYIFERSHSSSSNCVIEIKTGDPLIRGTLKWRSNYKALDPFDSVEMKGNETLRAELPAQAPLKKLQYFVKLHKGNSTQGNESAMSPSTMVPAEVPVIIRFRGDVPLIILLPHIFAMFFAMMLSTRTALEVFQEKPKLKKLAFWTVIFLFIGGFLLGFLMNYFAFNQIWGGIPIGNDITDNKTLIAFVGWGLSYYMIKKDAAPKLFAVLAALIMFIVYSIPHSV